MLQSTKNLKADICRLSSDNSSLSGFAQIVRDFIDNERKHIALEEEVVFPAIVDTLEPQRLG